jgi:hypothetical protein
MRGSITQVSRNDGSGWMLAENGKEIYFARSETSSNGADNFRVVSGRFIFSVCRRWDLTAAGGCHWGGLAYKENP